MATTPRFVRADGSFDKKAYNKWYYEQHKGLYTYGNPRALSQKHGPKPKDSYSNEHLLAQNRDNEKYYRDAMRKNKWTMSPLQGTAYTDAGAHIDDAMDYSRHNQDFNHRYKMQLAKESGASSTDIAKMDASYKRAQAYADNERAKQLKSYQQIKNTYTKDFENKLKKDQTRRKIKKLFKDYQDTYNIGMDTIVDNMKAGASAVDKFLKNLF